MSNYRRRLERDLDSWIGQGLVSADSRAAILGSITEPKRLDAATVLAVVGALLAGAAIIAFAAANWAAIPRIIRFDLILSAFLGVAAGAAWAHRRGRAVLAQALLCVAALTFAAAIGLTGQIFDIAGDPQAALRGAAIGALLLALAGRSPWAAAVGIGLLALGDFADQRRLGQSQAWFGWLIVAAPLAAAAALRWRSSALAHAAGLAAVLAVLTFDRGMRSEAHVLFLSAAAALAVAAAAARALAGRFEAPAGVLYGWAVWGALIWFGAAGFADALKGVAHSIAWLALSIGTVTLGRQDRHGMVTAAGVVSLFAAAAALLFNLGVGLMTSAAVFGGLALAALVVAFVIQRRRK
jgi:uncharacterized membrane protein